MRKLSIISRFPTFPETTKEATLPIPNRRLLSITGQEHFQTQHLLSLLVNNPTNLQTTKQVHSLFLTRGSLTRSLPLLNNLIRCYSLSDHHHRAFFLYKQALVADSSPPPFNSFTYTFLVNSCTNSGNPVSVGTQLHGLVVKLGFRGHVYVDTALVRMYCAGEGLGDARMVFEEMPDRNSVTWNVMITGFVKLHRLDFARRLFDQMPEKNVVTWTGVIDGYVRVENYSEGFNLFRRMACCEGIRPSEITLLAILPAVSNAGDLSQCGLIHGYAEKMGFLSFDIRVVNSMLECYAKCGCIGSALRFFDDVLEEKMNLISWTTIISGLAMHGMGEEAIEFFRRMEKAGLKASEVTFLSVMNACSHGGLVEEGLKFFEKMKNEHQIEPNVKHYGCVVDMLGRVGRLGEAEKTALAIPKEIVNDVIWRTLLGACTVHGDVEMGDRVTERILEIERRYGGDYALMYNLFVVSRRFVDAERLRNLMDKRNAHKLCGRSVV